MYRDVGAAHIPGDASGGAHLHPGAVGGGQHRDHVPGVQGGEDAVIGTRAGAHPHPVAGDGAGADARAGVHLGLGGLGHMEVRPVAAGHVVKFLLVAVGGEAVPGAVQGDVGDLGGLGPGDGLVGPEHAALAGGPALGHRHADVAVAPVVPGHVAVGDRAAGGGDAQGHAQHFDILHPGDIVLGVEVAGAVAPYHALQVQGVDGGGVPHPGGHVIKAGAADRGLGGQELIEHLGGLGPGHGVFRAEGAVAVTAHISGVAAGDQHGPGVEHLELALLQVLGELVLGGFVLSGLVLSGLLPAFLFPAGLLTGGRLLGGGGGLRRGLACFGGRGLLRGCGGLRGRGGGGLSAHLLQGLGALAASLGLRRRLQGAGRAGNRLGASGVLRRQGSGRRRQLQGQGQGQYFLCGFSSVVSHVSSIKELALT